ncbi:hypothetical protein TWF970_000744 [Orbilia oligospora]|uniref:CHAT domain-containing protein n=1 Tax=Orbilia oligospora TaxID=2813651 RepID=A0A7C8VSX8_ORBOL|nr:hypothetical protein TWF970_000744 [Orbilia oligospora]
MEPFNISAEMASLLDNLGEELPAFIGLQQETLKNGPANDEQIELYIYACFLAFKSMNSMEHLEQAIRQAERWTAELRTDYSGSSRKFEILESNTKEFGRKFSSQRAYRKGNFARELFKRYQETGVLGTLNEAIDVMLQSLDLVGEYITALMLSNFGAMLGRRSERTGSIDDLNRAVDVGDMAVITTPQDNPDRAGYLSNLGNRLGTRFDRMGSMNNLNRAVEAADMAVTATPQDHPDRAAYLNNLGNRLRARFERTNSSSIDDLNRAIEAVDMAVAATPQEHSSRAGYLSNLGKRLRRRFEQTGSIDDLNRAISSYQEGWRCQTASPTLRIRSARQAAHILAWQRDWEASSLLLEQAVALLPIVSPRSLDHTDKQSMLAEFSGLASMSAAISLEAGRDAYHTLRLLELGRGIIASLLMDMREDISSLRERHPKLASEFISLRDALDSPVQRNPSIPTDNTSSSWVLQTKMRQECDRNFSNLIAAIRAQPGFDNFLLPPTETELKDAACFGPIAVINIGPHRCDAFIVERNRIQVLKLPGLKLKDVQKHAQNLRSLISVAIVSTLEWLWDVVCSPILDALDLKNPVSGNNWPHIWWIPTGPLSQFPLHAAGYYQQKSTNTVLDRVMSSYALSVKALMHGRQHHVRSSVGPGIDQALLVAMKETPDLPSSQILPFVGREVKVLEELYSSLQLKCVMPKLRKHDVLENLQECKVFHFAGHGSSHPTEPSQSYLLLEDWKTNPLTVGDIRDCRFLENPPFLGYLSACLTGANEAEDLADEGVHLTSTA